MNAYTRWAIRFLLSVLLLSFGAAKADNYAVIFTGGGGAADNHHRYYVGVMRFYNALVDDLNYRPQNIWIVSADGTNPAVDQSDGTNSDFSGPVAAGATVLSGTRANLQNTLATVPAGANDLLMLWTYDHGGGSENAPATTGEEWLTTWSGADVSDDDLASWVGNLTAGREVHSYAQCFSGGMLDNLAIPAGSTTRFGCAATNHYESSWSSDTEGHAAMFSQAIDTMGYTLTHDIYQYSYENNDWATDGEGPGGAWADHVEHPWKIGANLDIAVANYVGLGAGGASHWWSTAGNWEGNIQPNAARSVRVRFTSAGGDVLVNSAGCNGGYITADWSSGVGYNSYINIVAGGQLISTSQVIGDAAYGYVKHDAGTNTLSGDLWIGRQSTSHGRYNLAGGSLTVDDVYVGDEGYGTFNHSAGAVSADYVYIANQASGDGYYNLSGTGSVTASVFRVGQGGYGYVDQSGGTANISNLYLGYDAGSYGDYELSSGTLTASTVRVGYYGDGDFAQSGGTHTISGTLYMGYYAGGLSNTYTLQAGSLSAIAEYVGREGSATFSQSGGTNTLSAGLYIGYAATGSGTYNMTGGTLDVGGTIYVGYSGTGSFIHDGGTVIANALNLGTPTAFSSVDPANVLRVNYLYGLGSTFNVSGDLQIGHSGGSGYHSVGANKSITVGDELMVGYDAAGTLSVAGAVSTMTVTNSAYVGYTATGSGTLNIGFATARFSASNEYVGYNGTGAVTHSAGANDVTNSLVLGQQAGGDGTYNLSGGGAVSSNITYVGRYGSGQFNQTGGTHAPGYIYIGRYAGSYGEYNLSAGVLDVTNSIYIGYSDTGYFNYSGGTLEAYSMYVYAAGTMNVDIDWTYDGYLNVQGGHVDATGYRIKIDKTGGGAARMTVDSGLVEATNLHIGESGIGEGVQSGGTVAIDNYFYVGNQAGARGTYTITNGSLSCTHERIGYFTQGTLDQTGGTRTTYNNTYIGVQAGGAGLVNLSGGTWNANDLYIANSAASGTFNWSGGAFSASSVYIYDDGLMNVTAGNWTHAGTLQVLGGELEMNGNNLTLNNGGGSGGAVSSGTLHADFLYLGYAVGGPANGTMNHTGGVVDVDTALYLAYPSLCTASYTMSGSAELDSDITLVGSSGSATFTMNGGTFTNTNNLGMGFGATGSGTFLHHAGTLSSVYMTVGYQGRGYYYQDGGSTAVSSAVTIASQAGSSGLFDLQGGDFTAGSVTLNSGGTVNQSGGMLDVGHFYHQGGTVTGSLENRGNYQYSSGPFSGRLINHGSWTLLADWTAANGLYNDSTLTVPAGRQVTLNGAGLSNDGTITQAGNVSSTFEYIGATGSGTYVQNGGTHTLSNEMAIGYQAAATGTYAMNAGTLTCSYLEAGYFGRGHVQQAGGTITAANGLYLGWQAGSRGTYTLTGTGLLNAGAAWVGYAGVGEFVQSNGTHTVTYDLVLGQNASGDGTYRLGGGSLAAGDETVGYSGDGLFVQNGGANSTDDLNIGRASGSDGRYELGAGTLSANDEIVGSSGVGTMAHTGGSNQVAANLVLGLYASGVGTYELSGAGQLNTTATNVSVFGQGTFTQTGGTHTAGTVYVGYTPVSSGQYTISGGTMAVTDLLVGDGGPGMLNITNAAAVIDVSGRLKVGSGGCITAVPGATIHMSGAAFENEGTAPTEVAGLANVRLIFEGGTSVVDPVEVAGADLGAVAAGWTDNFVVGAFQLGGLAAGRIGLVDDVDNQLDGAGNEAMYVEEIAFNLHAAVELNGHNLYYRNGGTAKKLFHGDVNLDGEVDISDLTLLSGNYRKTNDRLWSDGDFNGDGCVDISDLTLLSGNYRKTSGGAIPGVPVPEPASMIFLSLAAPILLRRRK